MNKTISGLSAFKHLDSLFVSFIGFILILIYTKHSGVGISPDSIVYVSTARNIYEHGSWIEYSQKPMVDFPFFYPFFLSIITFFSRADVVGFSPYLNAAMFGGIIFCGGYLIGSFRESSRLYKITILLCMAISPALFEIYTMLWSETLFILLTILFIIAFKGYLRTYSMVSLLICALIAAIACVTRYAGITLIGTGLMLLVFDRSFEWRKKILHCAVFGLLSVSLLIANLVRNRLVSGELTGPREAGITSLRDNIFYYGKVICGWFPVLESYPAIYVLSSVFLFVVICIVFLRRSWFAENYATAENCFTASFIVYTVFIIGVSTLSHFEQINNRFISPVFVPLLVITTCWIPGTLRKLALPLHITALASIGLVTIAFQFNELKKLYGMYEEARDYGIAGYADNSWKSSPMAGFLRQHQQLFKPGFEVYSNAAEAVYFNGKQTALSLPHNVDKKDVYEFFLKKGLYLIWFKTIDDPDLVSLKELHQRAQVIKQYSFKDGDIYFVKPGPNL
ncbi:hypothetical protein HDF26_003381 [Pedobacter cryoconitis]|uniref:hypothetical protein n=1 Tax=Pedobacter cryoconitis TaxID=188932 RepID=UPI00160B6B20|nr:hypothetical protein [Pedobacter cryoconitis]MBB6272921.1 hypothetical protein [Pedobacter cryoconitis]